MANDYEVGYKKPPKETQFPKGRSGNTKGRPKGTKNLKADLLEELAEQIQIREGGREIRISKQRALLKSLVARAMKGNDRAASKIVDLCLKVVGIEDDADSTGIPLTAEEREVLKNLEARILRKAENGFENEKEGSP